MKRFSPIRIFKIYSKKRNEMNDVRIKDILDKIILFIELISKLGKTSGDERCFTCEFFIKSDD